MPDCSRTKKRRLAVWLTALALLLAAAAYVVVRGIWFSGFHQTEDSFFSSPFLSNHTVLVLVAHSDDEANLAFGLIDAFERAGSTVTVAIATNGDAQEQSDVRAAETVAADALMGVSKNNIILLGYGDHLVPPFFYLEENLLRESDAGHTETYGGAGIKDYHTLCTGEPAEYTRANFEGDIRRLILNLKPDVILASDTDYHIDHVSVSQSFDAVMGTILRENPAYRPLVLKGFCYDYSWFGNDDFYNYLTLQSALAQWNAAAYNTAFPWEERIRFPLPPDYLGYTLRSSKLRKVLLAYRSQDAVSREGRMLNGDKLLWERRTDILWGHVTATSGNASLLQDFLISDTMEAPLRNCWIPDAGDEHPTIRFSWDTPQTVAQIVFYDAPPDAGDVLSVRVADDTGFSVDYALPSGSGTPCRLVLPNPHPAQTLTVEILQSRGDVIGFSEIELLPERKIATQWIHLLDPDGNFIYEYPCPAHTAMSLPLYGYPSAPEQATATLAKKDGVTIADVPYDGKAFQIPPLPNGRYILRAEGGGCTVEAILRVGDSLFLERVYRWAERLISKVFPE